MVQQGWGQH